MEFVWLLVVGHQPELGDGIRTMPFQRVGLIATEVQGRLESEWMNVRTHNEVEQRTAVSCRTSLQEAQVFTPSEAFGGYATPSFLFEAPLGKPGVGKHPAESHAVRGHPKRLAEHTESSYCGLHALQLCTLHGPPAQNIPQRQPYQQRHCRRRQRRRLRASIRPSGASAHASRTPQQGDLLHPRL